MRNSPIGKLLYLPFFGISHTRITDNQINAGVVEKFSDREKCILRLVKRISAPHIAERCIIERLHPHGNSVDAFRAEHIQKRLFHIKRMQFNRNLRIYLKAWSKRTENSV